MQQSLLERLFPLKKGQYHQNRNYRWYHHLLYHGVHRVCEPIRIR